MLKKNEKFSNIEIIDYTHEGMGVARINEIPVFIKYAKKGEFLDIKIVKTEKKFAFGLITSEMTQTYPCPHFKKCGGCHIMHLDYQEQCDFKTGVVANIMRKTKLDVNVVDAIKNPSPLGYRNKILMAFTRDEKNQINVGFFREKSHDIEVIEYCHLQSELVNEVVKETTKLMNQVKETVYNEDKHQGNLRHLYIRQGVHTDELMVCFILNGDKLKDHRYVVKTLTDKFPQIKSVVINVNKRKSSAVLGFKNFNLYNANFINEKLEDFNFRLLPNAFFQINSYQTVNMYNKIVEYANLDGSQTVLDAYCGVGSISLFLAKQAKTVVGIEISPQAIKSANENKKINEINNVEFICNDINLELENYQSKNQFFDAVIVDPPRRGLEQKFIIILRQFKPKTLVYVSCNPATLARDLNLLEDIYKIEEITPFDMFSQTYHVECVVKLTLK